MTGGIHVDARRHESVLGDERISGLESVLIEQIGLHCLRLVRIGLYRM